MSSASTRWWLSLLVRTLLTLFVLLWLSQHWGHYYIETLLPLYRAVLDLALSDYAVLDINTTIQNGEQLVAAHLQTIHPQKIGNRVLPAGITVDASTLAGHALKHVVIVVGALFVWPGLTVRERCFRFLLSIFPLMLLEAVDIPLALAGAVEDVVYANLSPTPNVDGPWLTAWLHVLDGGGRLALSVLTALAVGIVYQSYPALFQSRAKSAAHPT